MNKKCVPSQFFSISIFIVSFIFSFESYSQKKTDQYKFTVNLNNTNDDKLTIEFVPPKIKEKTIIYNIPKIVPGTYSISDFGRFVTEFTVTDKKGRTLEVKQLDDNRWEITNPKKAAKISYKVDDTWDTKKDNVIFEPAGTNIEKDTNYVINTHGFFGYFDGYKTNDYHLTFNKEEGFYGSTSLISTASDAVKDIFIVDDYMDLADAPIMYNIPDTTILNMGDAEVLVSVYSPNKTITSEYVGENINAILQAQRKYLGGTLPIKKYAFIIYLSDKPSLSGMLGALEHSYSSMYYLPEIAPQYITQSIRDIAAHEFFHIVTPLSIHSEEIQDFDYINPKMSEHLWLYEGVTEYSAGHMQVMYELISMEEYLDVIRSKMLQASTYIDDLPFTEMSKKVLDEYEDQYGNVYEKGALIGLCLDLTFRDLSDGEYGLRDLMVGLSDEYGKEKPFKDEELFDQIATISGYPEIRTFFSKYVEGAESLPIKEVFEKAGIDYQKETTVKEITMGNIIKGLVLDNDSNIVISDVSEIDDFGVKMGYEEGDIIRKVNGDTITLENVVQVIGGIRKNAAEGDTLSMVVERSLEEDKIEQVELKAEMGYNERKEYHIFQPVANMTERQRKILKSWLVPKEE
ncbi:peptidase M61 [Chondrinema litorale]|uniref:M61 family metallopeptidase n=1 Tax=Chondrinema litorale TaxID=2994555 RepID=UPI0025432E5C|nr:peptidase M61 [Chondrinema litorale]UZR92299.1 peptidase M61 [Chondrinema litorale]